ncbi:MAG TPA: sulfotransferase [Gaiellaceae bacterium]|nr:sulfotransferase [Gaiellaceae bacterium]
MVSSAGLFIGANRRMSEDAVVFSDYSYAWIDTFVRYRSGPIPPDLEREMVVDLAATLFAHLADLARPQPWGWKEPRSIFLLPFFHQHLPSLRFLHVVRDGRDMAFSRNQNQLQLHGLASGITGVSAMDSITLWSRVNMQAADYGEERLGSRYLRVRFEDLCAQPVETASRVLAFFELEADPRLASSGVRMQPSIGRWRREDRRVVSGLQKAAGAALARFGYS